MISIEATVRKIFLYWNINSDFRRSIVAMTTAISRQDIPPIYFTYSSSVTLMRKFDALYQTMKIYEI